MKKQLTYQEKSEEITKRKINQAMDSLPDFVKDYFIFTTPTTTIKTRLAYLYDIRLFLRYISNVYEIPLPDMQLTDLERVTEQDIEKYLDYLGNYVDPQGHYRHNSSTSKSRKLISLRGFFNYFFRRKLIHNNPTLLLKSPKIRPHRITFLNQQEVEEFLDFLENGSSKLKGMQKAYFLRNQTRNLTLCILLLGTGIRVSECVGLDIQDVDFQTSSIRVIRKGEKEDIVYFGEEVAIELQKYMNEREKITPLPGHENALFLSSQKKRMCVHAVENMIISYTSMLFQNKHITPHKLRSTFGTSLYRETRDIFLVAECLGHSDINTTTKHYAVLDEERKKMASNAVKLRKTD